MLISNIAIRRPVFTAMVTVALMTLGLLGARSLGVDLFPDVSFPATTVITVYPGAGPEEVEQLVTKQIEEALSSINGVNEVHSISRDSVSRVVLVFKIGTDFKQAATDVREKVAAIRSKLPRDIRDPLVLRMDPSAVPILTYAVSSARGPAETRRIVEDVVKPKLESLDGVAAVTVNGGLEREVHVFVDRARLEELGLSLAQVAQQLATESFDLPGGRINQGEAELSVRTLGRFRSLEELKSLVVASLANGSQVRLADVARIDDGFKEVRTRPLLDGQEAVTFELQKAAGTNTVAIADAVYKRLEELKGQLPADFKVSSVVDASSYIRFNFAEMQESILWGGAMAILIIFLFMLDWRSTFISSLALPTSVVTTFFAMYELGFTFNMMSMMGLSLAIGLLIDDAVVVRENIFRHMERGEDPVTAAQRGTAEIGLAVMATTFTIVAVFVPVAFMGGIVGMMMKEFGLTVAAAVLVSLFISFTLDPMMSARVVKPIEPGHHQRQKQHRVFGPIVRAYDRLDAYYREMLYWALEHKKTVALSATALFVASLGILPLMGSEFMSMADRGEFKVGLEAPAGTSFEEMTRITREAERLVRGNPHVRTLYSVVAPDEAGTGAGNSNVAVMRVYATKKQDRPGLKLPVIQQDIRERLSQLPSVTSVISDIQFVENAGMDRPLMIYVQGENYDTLKHLTDQVVQAVRSTPGTADIDTSYRPGKPETNIHLDRARAADLGVTLGVVAQTVRLALEGDEVAKYRQGDRDWPVRLQLSPEDRVSAAVLPELTVPATGRRVGGTSANPQLALLSALSGPRLVRIGEVADIEGATGPAMISRFNRQRLISVTGSIVGRSLGDVVKDIEAKLAKIEKPAGYTFEFMGQTKNMRDAFLNMGIALAVAVLFIYFVLASQFESFVHPITIMFSLPLAMVGALVALFVLNLPIGMISLIGIILLMGLVTKNAILLVDYTNELRARGRSMTDALLEAGPTRLRPILMTSAAMVLGMLPAAISQGEGSEMRAPMAIAVIGGVITSTLLTLIVVPVVYTWMDRLTLKNRSAATVNVYAEGVANAVVEAPAAHKAIITAEEATAVVAPSELPKPRSEA